MSHQVGGLRRRRLRLRNDAHDDGVAGFVDLGGSHRLDIARLGQGLLHLDDARVGSPGVTARGGQFLRDLLLQLLGLLLLLLGLVCLLLQFVPPLLQRRCLCFKRCLLSLQVLTLGLELLPFDRQLRGLLGQLLALLDEVCRLGLQLLALIAQNPQLFGVGLELLSQLLLLLASVREPFLQGRLDERESCLGDPPFQHLDGHTSLGQVLDEPDFLAHELLCRCDQLLGLRLESRRLLL